MISLSQWPSDLYSKTLENKYREVLKRATGEKLETQYDWGRTSAREFARVNIYYQTFLIEHIDEAEKYDVSRSDNLFYCSGQICNGIGSSVVSNTERSWRSTWPLLGHLWRDYVRGWRADHPHDSGSHGSPRSKEIGRRQWTPNNYFFDCCFARL